jgi:hypothetical protein
MPKRTDIHSVLILGAGPIVIGQACEFDYSGAQACKALRDEGYRVILVNSNPATIMTDPSMADATYIEPVEWRTVARIIEQERPDALVPTMGGQTALNCALDLAREGVLERFGVELIGHTADGEVPFNGILTSGYVGEQPGSRAVVTEIVPRIIARRTDVASLQQNDEIELPGGTRVIINDMQTKGEMVAIHYHNNW